ncbi:MAG: transcriptional regulator, partial [Burkholderiales bacterium]|nr:transcriptional regulator [Burkholderiales bacterium]
MSTPLVLRFSDFEWHGAEQRLTRDGQALELGSRAFDLLGLLASQAGRVVSKETAFEHVWPGRVVEENNLQVQVSTLRRLLGRDAIATVPGRGYRFTWPVAQLTAGAAAPPAP